MILDKFRAARSFSRSDWTTFFQAWALLLGFDLGLRLLPFSCLQAFAAGGPSLRRGAPAPAEAQAVIQRCWRMMRIASRNHLYAMTCLRRSLALQRMLYQRGVDTELRIGVKIEAGSLNAHAWLEHQGRAIGEPERLTEAYAELLSDSRRRA